MSSYSEGQIHQLANALELNGFTPEYITKLGQFKDLSKIRDLLYGTHELKFVGHIINYDFHPFCPEGWKVEDHRKGGRLEWNMGKISLYLSDLQEKGVEGNKLRKELESMLVPNANALDYLLAHPEIIPEEWKNKKVYFWGTIYRNPGGYLHVRCLRWNKGQWTWGCSWLCHDFRGDSPAVLFTN